MSHFTRMKTKIVKKDYLLKALRDLGYQPSEGKTRIRGFGGQETAVDIMIPTKNAGYDIGFRKTGQAFELVADWYGLSDIDPQQFLGQVQQRYTYHAVTSNMTAKGFEVVEEENQEDNTIHLTVRRVVF